MKTMKKLAKAQRKFLRLTERLAEHYIDIGKDKVDNTVGAAPDGLSRLMCIEEHATNELVNDIEKQRLLNWGVDMNGLDVMQDAIKTTINHLIGKQKHRLVPPQ